MGFANRWSVSTLLQAQVKDGKYTGAGDKIIQQKMKYRVCISTDKGIVMLGWRTSWGLLIFIAMMRLGTSKERQNGFRL